MFSWQRSPWCTDCKPDNSAQLEGTPTIPPSYIRVRAVVWECGEGQTPTHKHTQTCVTNIHFASTTTHAKCNNWKCTKRNNPVLVNTEPADLREIRRSFSLLQSDADMQRVRAAARDVTVPARRYFTATQHRRAQPRARLRGTSNNVVSRL